MPAERQARGQWFALADGTIRRSSSRALPWARRLAAVLALVLVAASCGNGDAGNGDAGGGAADSVLSGTADSDDVAASGADASGADAEGVVDAEGDAAPVPERIVSISPTGTEMLFAIDAGDRVVAADRYSDYPEEVPTTDLDGWNPNVEAIAGYQPDLVVMVTNGELAASLQALGVAVFAHDAPDTLDDVYTQIKRLGAVTGQADEAARLVDGMRSQIAELVADAPDASEYSYYHEIDETLYSATSSTFIGQVYSMFGLSNIADAADADGGAFGYPQLSDEYLVDADPDLIFLADTVCCNQTAQIVAERPGWDQLTAVRAGRIVEIDDDIASRWGPRLVDFIAAISDALASLSASG